MTKVDKGFLLFFAVGMCALVAHGIYRDRQKLPQRKYAQPEELPEKLKGKQKPIMYLVK